MFRLSVVVPAYNRGHLIGETLRSLLAQTLPADEIIVVDDGSTDNTADIAESFGSLVKVIRRKNGGPAAARNSGFAASKGRFIHFFDSDDLAASNKQEVQLKALEESGADIAVGPWIQGRFECEIFRAANHVLQQHGLPTGDLIKALLTHWSFVPHSALFRRSIVDRVNCFPEDLFVAEDQFMFLACLLAGAKVVHTPSTIEFYRLGDTGKITENHEWSMKRLREWTRFLIKARESCREKGIEPLNWFGYRRRLWEAKRDLKSARCADADLIRQLSSLAPSGPAFGACYWHRQIERWRGGLQQRLTGGRAHRLFKIGQMTHDQRGLLAKLGYEYHPPQSLPWWPRGGTN